MWTPNLYLPFESFSIDTASSKSFASSPSIVTIFISLKSFLLSYSFCGISSSIPSAKSKTFWGNSSGRPNFFIIVKISSPFSPFLPKISTILPSGLLLFSGHFVISTTTISPSFAPFLSLFETNISWFIFVSSATTKPKFLLSS